MGGLHSYRGVSTGGGACALNRLGGRLCIRSIGPDYRPSARRRCVLHSPRSLFVGCRFHAPPSSPTPVQIPSARRALVAPTLGYGRRLRAARPGVWDKWGRDGELFARSLFCARYCNAGPAVAYDRLRTFSEPRTSVVCAESGNGVCVRT